MVGINPYTFSVGHQWGPFTPKNVPLPDSMNVRANMAKIFGYIPVIGMIVGVLRILGVLDRTSFTHIYPFLDVYTPEEEKLHNALLIGRGIFEILQFGLMLLICDFIANGIRVLTSKIS